MTENEHEHEHPTRGCRCASCAAARLARRRVRVAARKAEVRRLREFDGVRWVTTAAVPHGVATTYTYWECRCVSCTEANRVANSHYVPVIEPLRPLESAPNSTSMRNLT